MSDSAIILLSETLENKETTAVSPYYVVKAVTGGFEIWDGTGNPYGVIDKRHLMTGSGGDLDYLNTSVITDGQTRAGLDACIIRFGRVKLVASGAITKGDFLMMASGNNGKVSTWTSGQSIGQAAEDASDAAEFLADVNFITKTVEGQQPLIATQVMSTDGAVTKPTLAKGSSKVVITKGTALAGTVATPTATIDDYKIIEFVSTTAAAHVFTFASGKINGSTNTTVTLGGAIGDGFGMMAYQGVYYTLWTKNATVA